MGEWEQNFEAFETLLRETCRDHIFASHWRLENEGGFDLASSMLHSPRAHPFHVCPCCLYYMVLAVYSPAEPKQGTILYYNTQKEWTNHQNLYIYINNTLGLLPPFRQLDSDGRC